MAQYEDLDLDEVEVVEDNMTKMKIKFDEKDHKIRVGFPLLKENGKVNIRVVKYFPFNEELKKSFLITGDEAFDAKVAKIMGAPKTRYVTLVVAYGVDKKTGVPVKGGGYEIKPFVFSDQVLATLQTNNAEFPLSEHDYVFACTNPDFQNFSMTPSKNSIWQAKDTLKARILEETSEFFKKGIEQAVSIKASKDQISSWLGLNESSSEKPIPSSSNSAGANDAEDESAADDYDISDLLDE